MQKISKYKTAKTYAQAWIDAADDCGQIDVVYDEVCQIRNSLQEAAQVWSVLFVPNDNNNNLVDIIDNLAKKLKLSTISHETLKLIAASRRLNILKLICNEFIHIYYQYKGITEVVVDMAVKLSAKQDTAHKKVLENKLQTPVVICYRIKPEVLGGLAIRFGSYQIDDTLANKIQTIQKIMLDKTA